MALFTLRNDFHNTEVRVRAIAVDGWITLTPSQAERARKALCGIKECTCSGSAGTRGPQDIRILVGR